MLGRPFGLDEDRPESHLRLEAVMRSAVKTAREMSRVSLPSASDFASFVDTISTEIGDHMLAQLSPDYEEGARLSAVKRSVAAFLSECGSSALDWAQLISSYVGRGQIRLMTIHKSKGLEAHTVMFLHLQDGGFNQYADMEEEKFALFVAASRARERLFITTTSTQLNRTAPLWSMLEAADIPAIEKLYGS